MRRLIVCGLAVLTTAGVLAVWHWQASSSERALRSLPRADRAELFQRTRANVEQVCVRARSFGLDDFCRSQAELLLAFPECDTECVALAGQVLPKATR